MGIGRKFQPGIDEEGVKRLTCAMRAELTPEGAEVCAEAAEKTILRGTLREPLRLAFVLLSWSLLMACQAASSGQPEAVSAGALTKEYQESTTDARRKYDGLEITVKGLTQMPAMMPPSGEKQGVIFMEEKGANPPRRVACWFSNDHADQFSHVKGGQLITVKGIFNGEAGAELKFCKLVKID
jgi:putative nucleic acid binding protein